MRITHLYCEALKSANRNWPVLAILLFAWGMECRTAQAAVSQVVRFDFNAGHLMNVPRSQGISKAVGNQRAVARDIYNINADNSAMTWTSSQSFDRYERWAKGPPSGEGLGSFNIFLRSELGMTGAKFPS